jgi:hypothetical protein
MKDGLPYDDSDAAPRGPGPRAAALALDILKNAPQAGSWRFALDSGECSFSWSAASGYTAAGPAVIAARLLSNLCSRHKTRFIVSGRVAAHLGDVPVKRLGALVDQNNGEREEFYGLVEESHEP